MRRRALARGFLLGPLAAVAPLSVAALIVGWLALALGGQMGAGLALGVALTAPVLILGLPVAYTAAAMAMLVATLTGADLREAGSSSIIAAAVVSGALATTSLWLLLDRGVAWPWILATLPFAALGGWVFDRSSR